MAQSVIKSFAFFLRDRGYTTRMWENGYSADESNAACHELTEWARKEWLLDGEFLMLWSRREDTEFSGDSELTYALGKEARLVPNPFLEGDAEGFVVAFQSLVAGRMDELYAVEVKERILYNAV